MLPGPAGSPDCLDKAVVLLRPKDDVDEQRCRTILNLLARDLLVARARQAERQRPARIREQMDGLEQAADALAKRLAMLTTEEHYDALNRQRLHHEDWTPNQTKNLMELLSRLRTAIVNAVTNPELVDRGGNYTFGVEGTVGGWLVKEVSQIVSQRRLYSTISRTGVIAQVAALIHEFATGEEAPDQLFDKAKRAARLIRRMSAEAEAELDRL
jgi:hypothetical protein